MLLAIGVGVGAITLGWTMQKDQVSAFIAGFLGAYAPPVAATSGQVLEALKARGLDKATIVSGASNGADVNGLPLVAVAGCMAGKNAFGEPRNVAFYDEGNRNYRLVMTNPGQGDVSFHFALIQPGLVAFDEVASSTQGSNDQETVTAALEALLIPCFNPKG